MPRPTSVLTPTITSVRFGASASMYVVRYLDMELEVESLELENNDFRIGQIESGCQSSCDPQVTPHFFCIFISSDTDQFLVLV